VRFVWFGAVTVAAVAALLAVWLTPHRREVPGGPTADPDVRKQAILAGCPLTELGADRATLTLGPLIHTAMGRDMLVAVTPEGKLVECQSDGTGGWAGPYQRPPRIKVIEAAEVDGGGPGFAGYGWAAPDVARVEVVLPDGRVILASLRAGAYAYTATGRSPSLKVTVRAYDVHKTLIYQRNPDDP
jgi:hypothetical protein